MLFVSLRRCGFKSNDVTFIADIHNPGKCFLKKYFQQVTQQSPVVLQK